MLKLKNKNDFDSEVTVLRKVRQSHHKDKHLISLLATYEKNGVYHFIFPWAKADLYKYWEQFPNPPQTASMENWIFDQCIGLVTALQKVHRYETFSDSSILALHRRPDRSKGQGSGGANTNAGRQRSMFVGRHGDLKPQNILWFPADIGTNQQPNQGLLKIADFGSAQFRKTDSWYNDREGRIPNSATYQSPEYRLDRTYSTLCDIWALGCIYLEMLVWYFGGFVSIEQFAKERLEPDESLAWIKGDTFFSVKTEGNESRAQVKDSVTKVSLVVISDSVI